ELLTHHATISDSMVLSRCGWTPLQGLSSNYRVAATIVNGNLIYNDGVFAPINNSYAKSICFKH
ncbi:MAG: hypothetical protein J1F10_06200, partial [Muribaculaceae bacterium]|nr:hypothetical protein [Muribaculaceae bacterium]